MPSVDLSILYPEIPATPAVGADHEILHDVDNGHDTVGADVG